MQPLMYSMSLLTHVLYTATPPASCSERIVLRRYLVREELVEDRNLLHDVVAHLGHLGEEEESEKAGYTAESGCEGAAVYVLICVKVGEWRERRRTTLRLR